MIHPIATVAIAGEADLAAARRQARDVAAVLGFDAQDQTRVATAVSEIARNAFRYAGGGQAQFALDGDTPPQSLLVTVSDGGPGIPHLDEIMQGSYDSPTGMGMGITGARRLMDGFEIRSETGRGTVVSMRKNLPRRAAPLSAEKIAGLARELPKASQNPLDELQRQNQELLRAMAEAHSRQQDLDRLSAELEYTNRGVLALYAELDERAERLKRADEMKSKFLSHMSHELRTPLNSILALCRLLLEQVDGTLTSDQAKQVHFIRKSAENLFDLVNDLLDLAKVEAGKSDVKPSEFQVSYLFGGLRGVLRPLLTNPAVSLDFEEPAGVPPLVTDEGKVAQILRNFISNALKFTERGEVRVMAQAAGQDEIVFSVRDTGIGIAPEHQELVFQEFAQIDSPLQRKARGTGLGLGLAKKLAELLGGSVSLSSRVGAGSTFFLRIPRVYPGFAAGDAEGRRVPQLLAIDDEDISRYLIEQALSGMPMRFHEARNAAEGLRRARELHPDVILLDLLMPDMSGFDLLPLLKNDPGTARIPVVIVTSKSLTKEEKLALEPVVSSVISKEVLSRNDAPAVFQAEVRRALDLAAASA